MENKFHSLKILISTFALHVHESTAAISDSWANQSIDSFLHKSDCFDSRAQLTNWSREEDYQWIEILISHYIPLAKPWFQKTLKIYQLIYMEHFTILLCFFLIIFEDKFQSPVIVFARKIAYNFVLFVFHKRKSKWINFMRV